MKSKRSKKQSSVRRITVDERLTEDTIRILISELAEGVREFPLGEAQWKEEKEHHLKRRNYVEDMGIPPAEAEKWSWAGFREGQVFLSGTFRIVGKKKSPNKLVAGQGQNQFLLIEDLVRKDTEKLYFKALERRRSNAGRQAD